MNHRDLLGTVPATESYSYSRVFLLTQPQFVACGLRIGDPDTAMKTVDCPAQSDICSASAVCESARRQRRAGSRQLCAGSSEKNTSYLILAKAPSRWQRF